MNAISVVGCITLILNLCVVCAGLEIVEKNQLLGPNAFRIGYLEDPMTTLPADGSKWTQEDFSVFQDIYRFDLANAEDLFRDDELQEARSKEVDLKWYVPDNIRREDGAELAEKDYEAIKAFLRYVTRPPKFPQEIRAQFRKKKDAVPVRLRLRSSV